MADGATATAEEQYTDAQLADGTTLRFKGQLQPEEVKQKVADYRTKQKVGNLARDAQPEPTFTQKALGAVKDLGAGALKGAGHTLGTLAPLINKIPYVGETLSPSQGIKAWEQITKPKGTAQNIGYGGEQVGEFFIPGAGEEAGAAKLAAKLPLLGKAALPVAKAALSGLSTGAVNKAQGGSFTGGAVMGAGIPAVAAGMKALSPALAETALGITRKMRGFGKTPGKAALEEIEGVAPDVVAANAQKKITELTNELETKAAASRTTASTTPALTVISREQTKALAKNSKSLYEQLESIKTQLTKEFSTGAPIPTDLHPSKLLDLKRGIGDLEKSWNPEQKGALKGIVRKVYGALDKELDGAIPGSAGLNQRISSLITVAGRAASTDRGASLAQRSLGRLARPTGALISSVIGVEEGYRHGGVPGAVAGGLAGLVVPEMLSSPTVQMRAARTLHSVPDFESLGRRALFPAKRALEDERQPEKQ